jgi:hypothetical protein
MHEHKAAQYADWCHLQERARIKDLGCEDDQIIGQNRHLMQPHRPPQLDQRIKIEQERQFVYSYCPYESVFETRAAALFYVFVTELDLMQR